MAFYEIIKIDDLVKSHQSGWQRRKLSRVSRDKAHNPAPERDRWTFYEAIKIEALSEEGSRRFYSSD